MNDNHKFTEAEFHVPDPDENIVDELLHLAHARLGRRLERIRRPVVRAGVVESALGPLLVAASGRGLLTVRFLKPHDEAPALATLRRKFDVVEDEALTVRIGAEIDRLMHGDADAITRRPIDLSLVESDFQRRALTRLRQVPAGSVVSYQALAAAVGAPSAQRAVGNTVASNPVAIYVPCHRVIRSDGSIGNYGGGVERKLKLLRAEGFKVDRDLAGTAKGRLRTLDVANILPADLFRGATRRTPEMAYLCGCGKGSRRRSARVQVVPARMTKRHAPNLGLCRWRLRRGFGAERQKRSTPRLGDSVNVLSAACGRRE